MEDEKEFKQLYLFACARGLLPDAEGFLEKGVTPGIKDKEGRTGAHFSASRGELEMLQFLHSKGVDIDAEDKTGRSPLHFAALRDHESAVVFLASKAAWVDSCDATDCSPLHLAARGGSAATAARLLKLGARSHIKNQWNLTALGEAVAHGHVKVCTAMSAAGAAEADVLEKRVSGGLTLLHLAAGAGQAETVGWLLGKKLSVKDDSNEEGLTPLHCCALGGRLCSATVEKLISSGADCAAKDAKGRTPLDILEHPQDTPGLPGQLATLPEELLNSIKQRLHPKTSNFLGKNTAKSTHSSSRSAATTDNSAGSGGGSMSAAARLQAATRSEEVAEVLNSMTESDRVHRVKLWARLPAGKLQEVPGLSSHSKRQLTKVHEMMCAAERARTEESLQKDAQFQEDMTTPAVRSVVDAVVAEPSMGPYVTGKAQKCITKLRQLRDTLKASGGGQIYLDRLLEPWTAAVGERVRGMEMETDALIRDTLAVLCGPQAQRDVLESGGAPESMPTHRESEISIAEPRSRQTDEDSEAGAQTGVCEEEKPSVWLQAGQRLLMQLMMATFLIGVFWWREELPYQRKAKEAANLVLETDVSRGEEL